MERSTAYRRFRDQPAEALRYGSTDRETGATVAFHMSFVPLVSVQPT
jgi:hypothetical protein